MRKLDSGKVYDINQIMERVEAIGKADAPMVIVATRNGFKIGYQGTVWAETQQRHERVILTAQYGSDLGWMRKQLQGAK